MAGTTSAFCDSQDLHKHLHFSKAAIASVILSIMALSLAIGMGLMLFFLFQLFTIAMGPVVMGFPILVAFLGLVFGILGLIRTGRARERLRGRGLSVAGILFSVTAFLFSTAFAVFSFPPPVFEKTGGYRIFCTVGNPGEKLDDSLMNEVCRVLTKRLDPHKRHGISIFKKDNQIIEIKVPVEEKVEGIFDDPENLNLMLKGAGVLEFRILPTGEEGNLYELMTYRNTLKEKGPQEASNSRYIWCEIENPNDWPDDFGVVGSFGEHFYVLASNQHNETMLMDGEHKWKLRRAYPTTDQQGRRVIGFTLDEAASSLFYSLTNENIGRPLCILLDNRAISAPRIESGIRSQGVITGRSTQMEVDNMAQKLNAGFLPAPLHVMPETLEWILPERTE